MKTSFLRVRPLYQKGKKGDRLIFLRGLSLSVFIIKKRGAVSFLKEITLLSSDRSAYNNNPDIVKETIA